MKDYNYTLIAENIHKSFGNLKVLRGVTLKASKGDVVSIIGSSGSGKSTFLRCINFLETPDNGRVILDGEEVIIDKNKKDKRIIDTKQIQRLRSQLGMVFQSFNLWSHMSVLQNVMEGPIQVLKLTSEEAEFRAVKYLKKVGIDDKISFYLDVSMTQPFSFAGLILASFYGYFIFDEKPDFYTWVGAVIIFLGVIIITIREIKLNKDLVRSKLSINT